MEEEGDDVDLMTRIIVLIIIISLALLFRNQIYNFFILFFNSIQKIS